MQRDKSHRFHREIGVEVEAMTVNDVNFERRESPLYSRAMIDVRRGARWCIIRA